MRIGVLGINYKLADLKLRELLAKACQRRFGPGHAIHGDHSLVLLSTCNRTEVYFSSKDLSETHSYLLQILRAEVKQEFDQKIYSYFGLDCFTHLCKVTAGLDSAILAETEIQGQVKSAYLTASMYQILPSAIHYLFQKALKISKQVRSQFNLGRGMPDLEHAIFQIGTQFFSEIKNTRILFIGASDINLKILCHFKEKGIHSISLCNRSFEHAERVAKKHSIAIFEWEKLSSWHTFDWILFGTKSPSYLVSSRNVPEQLSRKLIMDLSVPRNVEPQIGREHALFNIDQVNRTLHSRKQKMFHFLEDAHSKIKISTQYHLNKFLEKNKKIPIIWHSLTA